MSEPTAHSPEPALGLADNPPGSQPSSTSALTPPPTVEIERFPRLRRFITKSKVLQWGTPILSLWIFIFIWQGVAAIFSLPSYILPTPLEVLDSLVDSWPALWPNLIATVIETVAGFAAAIVVGVAVSLLVASSKVIERLVYPILVTTQAVPKIAVAPIFLVWFGLGKEPRIVIAGLLAVFPIIISTAVGLIGVDPDLLRLARSTGAKRSRVFWQVRLPAAMPGFFAGLKLGVTLAVVGAVVGEFVGGNSGLGYIVINAQGNLSTSLAFASIVLLAVVGVGLFYIIDAIERTLVRWQ
jgi:NitT/TauT family transport system permease protein